MKRCLFWALFSILLTVSCEKSISKEVNPSRVLPEISNAEFADVLTKVSLEVEHVWEVFDAVASSDENGYDEEYTLKNVFKSPGYGVGEEYLPVKSYVEVKSYSNPLGDLIRNYYKETKAGVGPLSGNTSYTQPEDYITALEKGDMQIYWPYYDAWDGKRLPVVTYDPGFETATNVGIDLESGEEVIVDEELARERPVWIVNSNNDAGHISLEIFAQRGGSAFGAKNSRVSENTKSADSDEVVRTLILKSFCALRNYDNFFAGANEFFIKIGGIDHFTASTEAELKLFNPYVTDFMKVIKRKQVGQIIDCNVLLMSNWTKQLESCAFLISEDDGGTITQWNAEAVVKIKSKSYGVSLSIPINSKDDIVWRGSLACGFLEGYIGETIHFGDVDLVFDFLEY